VTPLAFTLATVALGRALHASNGFYSGTAFVWLLTAIGFAIVAMASSIHVSAQRLVRQRLVNATLLLGVLWQLTTLFISTPGLSHRTEPRFEIFRAGVALEALVLALGVLLRWNWTTRLWFPAALAVHAGLGGWTFWASPNPSIDVITVHEEAIRAVLEGADPYAVSFPNIYGPGSPFYNPDLVSNGRVLFGYPYPPPSLLVAIVGHVLVGDYRYAQLAGLIVGAVVLGYLRANETGKLAAMLVLTTPRCFFVLEQGWTEPVAFGALAATLYVADRYPRALPWATGLFVVLKQYLLLAGPLLARLALRRPRPMVFLGRAAGIALAVTLPFALWHPDRFLASVVLLQMREPFRMDSLSIVSWAARAGWGQASWLWSVGAGLLVSGICLWRTPNTTGGLAASVALIFLAFFAFGSKAFCNYYFFVIGAMALAIACHLEVMPTTSPPHLRSRTNLPDPSDR
jgi:hypothetical protein